MYSDVYVCLKHIMSPINPFFFTMNKEILMFDEQNSAPVVFGCNFLICYDTVDGRNPAPPGMYKTLWILGYLLHQLVSRISSINSMFIIFYIFGQRSPQHDLMFRGQSLALPASKSLKLWQSIFGVWGWWRRWSSISRFHPILSTVIKCDVFHLYTYFTCWKHTAVGFVK